MRSGLALLVMMCLASGSGAARAADVAHGKTVAERWCASCHVVAPEQTRAKADAPSFEDIARRRAAANLRLFLANPYPRMPNMSLSRDEIADLVAYIKSFGLAPGETPEAPPPGSDHPGADRSG